MPSAPFRPLTTLILPAALPIALAAVVLRQAVVPSQLAAWLGVLPPLAFGAILLLALRFNLNRIALAALVLGIADQALRRLGAVPTAVHFQLIAALVPLNLALVAWSPERGLLTLGGAVRVAALAVELLVAAWLIEGHDPELLGVLTADWLPDVVWLDPLGSGAVVACGLAGVVVVARFGVARSTGDGALVGALVASVLAVTQPVGSLAFDVYWAAAALVLLIALVELSHALAFRDELTGLSGRRSFNDVLRRLPGRYTVAMVDVDHFKGFNDRFGHEVGDQALRMVAGKLARVTGGGRSFRYGGEEFAVVFRGKDVNQATPHLEALRKAIAGSPFAVRGANRPKHRPKAGGRSRRPRRVKLTVSIGAASRDARRPGADEVVQAADKLLYAAKKKGRNRVES